MQGSFEIHRGCILLVHPFLHSISLKKKKKKTSQLAFSQIVAKSAARKVGFIIRSRRFFAPVQLLTLYKAQIRPCLEFSSHRRRGASKHSLATLVPIHKRTIRLSGDPIFTVSLNTLAHRRSVSVLSLFYRYYHRMCSAELKSAILHKACFVRSRRFADSQHTF